MLHSRKIIVCGLIVLLAILFELTPAYQPAIAQSVTASTTSVALNEATLKALQEALNRRGISVPMSGILNDETRAAVKQFQSQHHLPVTGDPDKATLDKLGVQIAASGTPETVAQAAPPTPQPPQTSMMNCSMMQNQMTSMMQTMQGMMEMMKSMQGMMSREMPGQMQPEKMQPGSR